VYPVAGELATPNRVAFFVLSTNYPPPPHKYPIDLETPDKIGNLTYQLLKNGFSEEDAKKILSGNLLRIFSQIWR